MKALAKSQSVAGLRGFAAMLFSIAASPILHEAGVSFQTISIGNGILYLILAAVEIPTGIWADIFGAKRASVLGGIFQTAAMVLLGIGSTSTIQILCGYALYGLGSSFVTRAVMSLMFETARTEEANRFNSNHFFSSMEKAAVASYILASFLVGFLSDWMGRSSLLIGGVFFLGASLFIASRFWESETRRSEHSLGKEFRERLRIGFSVIKRSPELTTLLPVRILHQIESILGVMWLPWIQQLGGGSAKWFSVLSTGSYILRYTVNHGLSKRPRPDTYMQRLFISLALMAAGSVVCVFAQNVWMALFGVWTMAGARGAFLPAVQAIQHEEFPDTVRTTGLSTMNFSVELMVAVSYFVSASVIDKLTVQMAWGISAICFLIAATTVALNKEPSYAKSPARI